ncbi:MAG: response regulator [Pedobacter sp.]|uniref:response regulator n=1 Tax=Pedobacter sp. TaxID=1411316 RepID=UPI002806A5C5|nr:response regulator [Pedobacter sp.]MDQ8003452.1 response regulator [Pedobacter sp.]
MNKKLMICDDDIAILEMVEIIMEDTSFVVSTEVDSRKLVKRLHEENIELLLLDLWMPVLSGEDILKTIRTDPALNKLKVMVMSAGRDAQTVAMDAGANNFIAKPFDIEDLIEQLEHL